MITLVLYVFLRIPGFITNVVYLVEANKTKKITGTNPDGYGCLWALLIVVCGLPLALLVLVLIVSAIAPAAAGFH